MKITSNKNKSLVTLELNKREFEIFTTWIGSNSGRSIENQIKSTYPYHKITNIDYKFILPDYFEIEESFGSDTYRKFCEILKEDFIPTIIKIVEFVYDKDNYSESPKWRNLHVTSENSKYIEGLEDGKTFKKFLKSRIVGGKIITVG